MHDSTGMTHQAKPSPRFCPQCRSSFPGVPERSICPSCGDALLPKGYCSVCEDYWPLQEGTSCPKHDIPLDSMGPDAPEPILDGEGRPLRWTTVAQYSDSQAASAPRIRLEAEGIPTFLDGERMGSRAMYHVATGGVRLKVPDTLAEDARIILSQTWSATAAELDIDDEFEKEDFDDQDSTEDEHASHPHDLSVGYNFLIFLALGLPSLLLAYLLLRYLY